MSRSAGQSVGDVQHLSTHRLEPDLRANQIGRDSSAPILGGPEFDIATSELAGVSAALTIRRGP